MKLADWSGFLAFEPNQVLRPANEEELAVLLTTLAQHEGGGGGELRALGSLHSCARICESTTVLDVTGLPRTLEVAADERSVVLSTNHTLHDTLAALSQHEKSLAATGGTDHQTLAGLISTGTAPATPHVSLYDGLEWVEYMTIDETTKRAVLRRLARGDVEFPGVVCSLGAIGVLLRAKFALVDEPYFAVVQKIVPISEVLSDLEATSRRYEFWRVNWLPKSDCALLWAAARIPKANAKVDGDYPADGAENILKVVFQAWDAILFGRPGPLLDPVMEAVYRTITTFYGEHRVTGPLRNMLPVDRRAPLHVAMAEWSFAPGDLQRVLAICRTYFEAQGWPNIPTEIELTPSDAYWMSPWNWPNEPYIAKLNFMYLVEVCKTAAEKAQIVEHLRGLWNVLLEAGLVFKAHWGKINFLTPDYVRRHYRPDLFRPLMRHQFVNDYLRERLL